jgi:NADPH2 dehydrogenase
MSKLFTPIQVGSCHLQHRIAMAPMTRRRADENYEPSDLMVEYYAQRASVTGTLLISEAVATSPRASVWQNTTGLYTAEQMAKWKPVVEAVHAKGSFIFAQLWITGRAARPLAVAAGADVISSSAIPWSPESAVPRSLREEEIWACIDDFRQAAINAVAVGFDGVEIHGANGYLVDQFTQDTCNQRTDGWGGSIEKRARFGVEVAKAVVGAVGHEKVGFRISPWCRHHGMGMADPIPQFTHLLQELRKLKLAYLHIIEARVSGNEDSDLRQSIDMFVDAWNGTSPVIVAGGYTAESARDAVDGKYKDKDVLIAFGRQFISNPDLPLRVKQGIPFTKYNRDTFYEVLSPKGYTDYAFYSPAQTA